MHWRARASPLPQLSMLRLQLPAETLPDPSLPVFKHGTDQDPSLSTR
jgi:hypothetical protein